MSPPPQLGYVIYEGSLKIFSVLSHLKVASFHVSVCSSVFMSLSFSFRLSIVPGRQGSMVKRAPAPPPPPQKGAPPPPAAPPMWGSAPLRT